MAFESFKETVVKYTGLSPAAFFTAVAVGLALYYFALTYFAPSGEVVSSHHGFSEEKMQQPLPPPVQVGEITDEELKQYDGSDPKKPLLMAIKGQIYDVTQSRMFYGPGGPYALFAGKDASRALAKMSFEKKDLTGDLTGLGVFELEALQDWEYKFISKYVKVGTVMPKVLADESQATEAAEPAEIRLPENAAEETEGTTNSLVADKRE